MLTISLAEAKNRLSELVTHVEAGEVISITRRGIPVARLVAAHVNNEDREAVVSGVFRQMRILATRIHHLDGDLRPIAREGLD